MTPFSTEVRTLFRLLQDGQWHDWRLIKDRLAQTVAPGKALRKYEERQTKRRDRLGSNPMPSEPNEDEKILFGQRLLADAALQGIKKNWLDVDHSGGGYGRKMVRLRPGAEIPDQNRSALPGDPGEDLDDEEGPEELLEAPEPAEEELEGFDELPAKPGLALTLTEECPECFQLVTNPERHAEWHQAMHEATDEPAPAVPAQDMALFSEADVRRIVAEEISRQLDGFQTGMQQWLSELLGDPDHMCLLRDLRSTRRGVPIDERFWRRNS